MTVKVPLASAGNTAAFAGVTDEDAAAVDSLRESRPPVRPDSPAHLPKSFPISSGILPAFRCILVHFRAIPREPAPPLDTSIFPLKSLILKDLKGVGSLGLEPRTNGLKVRCSTD